MHTERSTSTFDRAALPDDVPTLHAMIRELLDALKKSQHEREGILELVERREA